MIIEGQDDEGRVHDLVKVCDFGVAKLLEGGARVRTEWGALEAVGWECVAAGAGGGGAVALSVRLCLLPTKGMPL